MLVAGHAKLGLQMRVVLLLEPDKLNASLQGNQPQCIADALLLAHGQQSPEDKMKCYQIISKRYAA